MSHVNYCGWAHYLFALFRRHHHVPRYILDISCGTGSLMVEFIKNGCDPFGADRSLDMLMYAAQKLYKLGKSNRLFIADISAVPVKNVFDTILCTYDSMNYISPMEALITDVQNIVQALPPNGVFIFDVSSEYNCRAFFNGTSFSSYCGSYKYTQYSYFQQFDKIEFTDFIIQNIKTSERFKERHVQYIYPVHGLYAALQKALPHPIFIYKDYTFEKPLDEQCERVHFYIEKTSVD